MGAARASMLARLPRLGTNGEGDDLRVELASIGAGRFAVDADTAIPVLRYLGRHHGREDAVAAFEPGHALPLKGPFGRGGVEPHRDGWIPSFLGDRHRD